MNATDVVGYAFDADVHCLSCTEKRFGAALGDRMSRHDPEADEIVDGEGNPIHPMFAGDATQTCGECRGSGLCICQCRTEHSCNRCDGDGTVPDVCGDCHEELF